MKKLISILLALTLVVLMIPVMSLAVFAEGEETTNVGPREESKNVTATYDAGETSAAVYSINLSWGSLAFTYTAAGEGTWDPDSLTYTGTSEATWTCDEGANEITVTNFSNVAIEAKITHNIDAVTGEYVDFTWDNDTLTLESAVGKAKGEEPTATAKLTVSGSIAASEQAVTIGTVTVAITDPNVQEG